VACLTLRLRVGRRAPDAGALEPSAPISRPSAAIASGPPHRFLGFGVFFRHTEKRLPSRHLLRLFVGANSSSLVHPRALFRASAKRLCSPSPCPFLLSRGQPPIASSALRTSVSAPLPTACGAFEVPVRARPPPGASVAAHDEYRACAGHRRSVLPTGRAEPVVLRVLR